MSGVLPLVIGLAIALYVCWLMVQPFTNVILWAAVLAIVFYPMHRRIRARVANPSAAAILSMVLVVVLILLPATFITIAVVRELAGAADNLQAARLALRFHAQLMLRLPGLPALPELSREPAAEQLGLL